MSIMQLQASLPTSKLLSTLPCLLNQLPAPPHTCLLEDVLEDTFDELDLQLLVLRFDDFAARIFPFNRHRVERAISFAQHRSAANL